jgi:hypothetical protein
MRFFNIFVKKQKVLFYQGVMFIKSVFVDKRECSVAKKN